MSALEKNRDPRVAASPDPAIRRLTNIRPREVSLVDSAANGREFLIIKRKDAMARKDKTLFKNAVDDKTTTATGNTEPPKEEGDPVVDPPKKAADTTTQQTDVKIQKVFTAQVENDLKDIPLLKALASDQKDMFLAMSQALVSMAGSMDMIRSDLLSFADSDGLTKFMGEPIENLDDNVRKCMEGLEDGITDSALTALVDIVEKKGNKMKKARLTKLRNIMSNLSTLVTELETESNSGSATGGSSVSKDAQGSESGTNKEEKSASSTDQKVEKSSDEKLAGVVEAAVTKAVKPLEDRLHKLEGTPNSSASENVDTTEDKKVNKSGKEEASIFKGVIY